MSISVYSTYNMVISQLLAFLSSIFNGVLPFFGRLIAKGDQENLQELYKRYCFVYYMFVFIIFTVAFCMYPAFIKLFTSGVNDVEYYYYYYVVAFITVGVLEAVKSPYILIIAAGGYYKETSNDAILETMINLVLSVFLCIHFSIIGVLCGTAIAHIIRLFYLFRLKNTVKFNIDNLYNMYLIFINTVISLCCIFLFDTYWTVGVEKSWLLWIINSICLAFFVIICFFICYLIVLKKDILWFIGYMKHRTIGRFHR